MCFGCSKELYVDNSFEYPLHMFWLRNKTKNLCDTGDCTGPLYEQKKTFRQAVLDVPTREILYALPI